MLRSKRHLMRACCGLAILAAADVSVVHAATSGTDNEEIVVTARRREERQADVPMSITAARQEELLDRGVRATADLPKIAPGLSLTYSAGRLDQPVFAQRGQGQAFGGSAPGVATYFADVPDFATQIFDLQSVQVFKGPQGTLFGRNTTGGAVQLVPQRPGDVWSGYVLGRVGELNRGDVEFGVGGPVIGDVLLVRLSGQLLTRDGYTKNADGRRFDDENRYSMRAAIVLRPMEGLENYTILQLTDADEVGVSTQIAGLNLAPAIASPFSPSLAGLFPGTINLSAQAQQALADQRARGPRSINIDGGGGFRFHSEGIINTTTYDITGNLTLKNIYSYRKFRVSNAFDFDGTNLPIGNTVNPTQRTTEQTEEVQLQWQSDWFNATAGYYWERVESPFYQTFRFTTFWPYPTGALGPLPPQGTYQADNYDTYAFSQSLAFYGEATVKVTDQLALTGGIRRTHDQRRGGTKSAILFNGVRIPLSDVFGNVEFDATTWNVSAVYEAAPDLHLYATVRRGYKAGGVNNTALGDGLVYQPETVTDYEMGAKYAGEIDDWRVAANIDVFYDDYKDIQRAVVLPGAVVSTITENAAAATMWGVDLQFNVVSPNAFITLSASYSYLNAEYDAYSEPVYGDLSNSVFPQAPEHQLSLSSVIKLPVDEAAGDVLFRTDVTYQSETALAVTNRPNGDPDNDLAIEGSTAPASTRLDMRVDWKHVMQSDFSVGVYVFNVTDEETVIAAGTLRGGPTFTNTRTYAPPRMAGMEVRYEF